MNHAQVWSGPLTEERARPPSEDESPTGLGPQEGIRWRDLFPVLRRPWWQLVLMGLGAVLALGILAFATFKPIQVLPRIRLAPGYSMIDQDGNVVTSEDMRGTLVLYAFTYTRCHSPECQSMFSTLKEIDRRLPETGLGDLPFRIAVVSFDPEHDTPARLRAFARDLGVDTNTWVFLTGTDPRRLRYVIGGGFEVYYEPRADGTFLFDPTYILVDGWGIIRGEYRYQTVTPDTDRIVRHIKVLVEEIQRSKGAAKVAYEAAHLFLCYAQ